MLSLNALSPGIPARVPRLRPPSEAISSGRKRVWIVTARVGAGHVQAARAIEESLFARGLARHVRYIDVMEHVPRWFRKVYAGGYAQLATHLPMIYGLAYHLSDRRATSGPRLSEHARLAFEALMLRSLREEFRFDTPDWIVHTHFLAPGPMGRWIRAGGLPTRQAVVVTDFHPHRIWMADPVHTYFVATQASRDVLLDRGVAAHRAVVTGIPIMAKHRRTVDCRATGAHFDWHQGRPVILVIAGSDFMVGPVGTLIDRLLHTFPHATVQVATGRNEALYRQLLAKCERHVNLRAFAFTDRMNELICCATIVVSKTGGITTSECLAHGSAMIGFFPVPGQETHNADYLVTHGAGLKVTSIDAAVGAIRHLLDDERAHSAIRSNALRLGRPRAAEDVADYLLESLSVYDSLHSSIGA